MSDAVYTPAQASAVADLPLKTVQKLMDVRMVRPRKVRAGREVHRLLTRSQLVYLRLEAGGLRLLPVATRREVARVVETSAQMDTMQVSGGSVLTIEFKPAREDVERQLVRLQIAQQMAISDPGIMRGTPVYSGTRIPVELVAKMLSDGTSVEEILDGYPALDREKVELAPFYMRAFPRRGRPPQRPWAKQQPVRVTRHVRASVV
jgi:uncharacterized protein (DUF433 family)